MGQNTRGKRVALRETELWNSAKRLPLNVYLNAYLNKLEVKCHKTPKSTTGKTKEVLQNTYEYFAFHQAEYRDLINHGTLDRIFRIKFS